MINSFFSKTHRLLGLLLCLLFLMWFLSGFVMIYHSFPRASQEYKLQRQQPLCGKQLPTIDTLLALVPDPIQLQSLSIEMRYDRPAVSFRGENAPEDRYLDNLEPIEGFNEEVRQKTVKLWCDAPVSRIDTLHEVDQWIPQGGLNDEMPVYKYYFDDSAQHQLYMTSHDGKVLQFTDKEGRFWAWLGAIPHWVYFTSLRQHQTAWIEFVKWASGIGCLMCLAGIWIGIRNWWKQRKQGLLRSPYRKRWYKWHFISGILFGLFTITFAFSGLMSLTDLPDWLKKASKEKPGQKAEPRSHRRSRSGGMLPADTYVLDYRKVLSASDSIKSITWSSWNKRPYYTLRTNGGTQLIDASDSLSIRPFRLSEEMIRADVRKKLGDSAHWTMALLTEYDADYYDKKKGHTPLPVYRVIVDDKMHTRLYYNPETLSQRSVDDDGRTRRFLYSGLHSLNIKFLTDRPVLWNIVMFTLLIGGTFLSLTGVILSMKWIIRKIKTYFN